MSMTVSRTIIRTAAALALVLGVSACATTPNPTVSRAAAIDAPQPAAAMALDIQAVSVQVPDTLKVSEANSYYPGGDIVWRGEPMGDRRAQVRAMFEEAMTRGTDRMTNGIPVRLDVQVLRFHALTEKARYSFGGVHDLSFALTLRDPATGAALMPTRRIDADLKAFGGNAAIAADQRGETQKVRITDHLAGVIRQELMSPGSYRSASMGLMSIFTTN